MGPRGPSDPPAEVSTPIFPVRGSWEGGRAASSASQAVAGVGRGRRPGLGPGDLGGDQCQERGAGVRKLGQLRGRGRVRTGAGGIHSVTSSPSLPRARLQRALFDSSQHAPLPPGPSAQPVRVGLVGLGLSDCRCVRVRTSLDPHPSACLPLPTTYRSSKLLCQTFLLNVSLYVYSWRGWVDGR